MDIHINTQINKHEWTDFVKSHPQGCVFQTPEMFELYQKTSHHSPIALAAVKQDRIVGILVAVTVSNGSRFLKFINARSIIIGGPLILDNDPMINEALLKEYCKNIPWYTIYSEIRPVYDMNALSDSLFRVGFNRTGHYNLVLNLESGKDVLWETMHKERRRNILRAQREGLVFSEVSTESGIQGIISLIKETYRRKRVPLTSSEIFSNAKTTLGSNVRFFAAYSGNVIVAGQVRLCYGSLVYAWYAGSDDSYFKLRPNDFLMWNVILWACDHGFKSFDFGGGGEPGKEYGVRDYKLKYGCDLYDYGRYLFKHRPLTYFIGKAVANVLIKR